jgi:hypothetical protein
MTFLKKKHKPSPESVDSLHLEAAHPAFKELFDNAKEPGQEFNRTGRVLRER